MSGEWPLMKMGNDSLR